MKAILLSFAFVYFCESRLFKALRAKKIKNFSSAAARVVSCGRALQTATTSRISARLPEDIPLVGMYSDNFRFCQADEVQDGGGHEEKTEGLPSGAAGRCGDEASCGAGGQRTGMAEPDGRRRHRMERPF
jgi:hypothetical protein